MKDIPYMLPTKIKGKSQINVTYSLEPEVAQVFREYADTQTARYGVKISIGTVLKTAMLQRYPEVMERYKQLKQENQTNEDKKYMDIKRDISRAR